MCAVREQRREIERRERGKEWKVRAMDDSGLTQSVNRNEQVNVEERSAGMSADLMVGME